MSKTHVHMHDGKPCNCTHSHEPHHADNAQCDCPSVAAGSDGKSHCGCGETDSPPGDADPERAHPMNAAANTPHSHTDTCNCGHTHAHTQASSCSCSSGEHTHDDGCGCGHDHGAEHSKSDLYRIIAGAVLLIASFIPGIGIFQPILAVLAALVPGYTLFWQGAKNLFKLQIDEIFLLTVAVIAAVLLGEYFEAAVVTILFCIGQMLESRAIRRSRREIEALTAIRPDHANMQDASGRFIQVDAQSVPIGSIIQIKPAERVPLDCVVLEGESDVDLSAITGESVPVRVNPGTELPSSGVNGGGLITCRTIQDFQNSSASRIIALVEESAAKKGKTENFITRFAKIYTPIIIILALSLAVLPPLLGFGAWQTWISRSLVFLVASCPCALVISVPLSFYAGIGAASKRGVIIKGSMFVERLSKLDCAVFDKTGTLTSGKLSVADVQTANGFTKEDLLHIASAAEQDSTHPIAQAIAAHHTALPTHISHEKQNFQEIRGYGISLRLDGQEVLCGSERFLTERSIDTSMLKSGYSVYVAVDGKAAGAIEIADQLRPDTLQTLQALKENFSVTRTVMLTGDTEERAKEMAAVTKVDEYHAAQLPEDKVKQVERCKEKYGTTLFVGDGINDAPVLASSDIGAAMGFGTDAAIEAADVVLLSDRLSAICDAVGIAKRTMGTAKFNIIFALSVKAVVLLLGAMGLAPMWMAVFADVGVSIIAVLNSVRILRIQSNR